MRRWWLLAAVILAAAAAGIAYPLVWQGHENSASEKDLKGIEKGFQASSSSSHCGSEIGGVLRIPSLGVVAPVKQGTSDAILSQAVGHLASTPWPGQFGTSELLGHDVGFFASDASLRVGDSVTYETSCDLLSFRIVAHFIEDPGQSFQAPGDQGLALISCWPPNALWWTSQRLIVTATLVSTTRTSRPPEGTPAAQEAKRLPPQVPAQPFLFDDGWLAGVLSLDGSPAPSWRNGPLPLQWEGVGLDALAAVHFGLERHSRWLSVLAPRVHIAQAFADGPTGVPVSVTEDVHGTTLQSITLSTDLGGQPVELVVVPRRDWAVVAKAAPVPTGPSGAG